MLLIPQPNYIEQSFESYYLFINELISLAYLHYALVAQVRCHLENEHGHIVGHTKSHRPNSLSNHGCISQICEFIHPPPPLLGPFCEKKKWREIRPVYLCYSTQTKLPLIYRRVRPRRLNPLRRRDPRPRRPPSVGTHYGWQKWTRPVGFERGGGFTVESTAMAKITMWPVLGLTLLKEWRSY